jgi:predicted PurR-regulated permease PerM
LILSTSRYRCYFTDPQAILPIVSLLIIYLMGRMLLPLFAAIVIACMLEGGVQKLERGAFLRYRLQRWCRP